jgi:hypothetical protein
MKAKRTRFRHKDAINTEYAFLEKNLKQNNDYNLQMFLKEKQRNRKASESASMIGESIMMSQSAQIIEESAAL